MRTLVTGGAGFIGSHLVAELVARGDEVSVLDNFATGNRRNLLDHLDDIHLVEGDLRSYERVHRAVRGAEVVFHQAALPSVPRSIQDPLTTNEVNVGGTLNVLLAARDVGARRVVFASSSSVYGDAPGMPRREELSPDPIAPYAVSKLAAEHYCRVASRVYALETVSLRYFNVFGSRQDPFSEYSAVIPKFISALQSGESPIIYGTGEQSRDFTHIRNVVESNLLAAEAPGAGGAVVNIGCGEQHSLNRLVQELQTIMALDIEPKYADPRPGDVTDSQADISAARQLLGFEPTVGFQEGLRLTTEAYQETVAESAR